VATERDVTARLREQLTEARAEVERLRAELREARGMAVELWDALPACEDCGQTNTCAAYGKHCASCSDGSEPDHEQRATIERYREAGK
jgi:hypothetical protein